MSHFWSRLGQSPGLQPTCELSSFSFIRLYLRSAYTTHPVLLLSVIHATWVKNVCLLIKTAFEKEKHVVSIASELRLIRDQKALQSSLVLQHVTEWHWAFWSQGSDTALAFTKATHRSLSKAAATTDLPSLWMQPAKGLHVVQWEGMNEGC